MRGAALAALRDTIALRRAESPGDMTGTGTDVTAGTGEDVRPDVTASGDVRVSAAHVHQVTPSKRKLRVPAGVPRSLETAPPPLGPP